MSVVVSRSTRVKSALSTASAIAVLFCVVLQFFSTVQFRRIRRFVEDVPTYDQIDRSVLATLDSWASSNRFVRVGDLAGIVSNVVHSSRGSDFSSGVDFVSVSDFATWEDSRGRVRARLHGCDCNVGDLTRYGFVLRIRPGRLLCQSSDGRYVVVCLDHSGGATRALDRGATPDDPDMHPLG